MRIAQIAPLYESVPPKLYGGTERIVSYLTEELVRQGHDVTLFASADSRTRAELVPCCEGALRLRASMRSAIPDHLLMLEKVRRRAREFDIMHFHIDYLHIPLFDLLSRPMLTTMHSRVDRQEMGDFFREFTDTPLAAISMDQQSRLDANWVGVVHHGLPRSFGAHGDGSGGYLAFLGRISPEKRPDRAIEIAGRAGLPLKIAAKVDSNDQAYFDAVIRPLLREPFVEYLGEINEREKSEFLQKSLALLFPIDWPEPFGLVMIEAMACGAPVIAWRNGSAPEVVEHGVTGFIVETMSEAIAAVDQALSLDRDLVRHRFEARFTAERMARDYISLYREAAREARCAATAA